jgi:hypothetical protein
MPASGINKEIKNWNQFERLSHLYSNMLSLGDAVTKALDSEKSFSQIAKLIKDTATDNLPTGEELNSALQKDDTFTLSEWLAFMDPPDILLERELCWPVEPDLVY